MLYAQVAGGNVWRQLNDAVCRPAADGPSASRHLVPSSEVHMGGLPSPQTRLITIHCVRRHFKQGQSLRNGSQTAHTPTQRKMTLLLGCSITAGETLWSSHSHFLSALLLMFLLKCIRRQLLTLYC